MSEENPESNQARHAELRARLAADVAAGRTISLSAAELAPPEVRQLLPQMLDELSRKTPAESPPALRIPGYAVLGEIGQGGMSTVHLARHEALGRYVALKIAPKWLGGHERAQERLAQEARAMARVSHPNIVAIHDIVDIGDNVVIAMEWIDGLTLAAILRALPAPPQDDDLAVIRKVLGTPVESHARFEGTAVTFFVRVMHDIALAVHHVHQAGLLHLDIKPSNVLVRRCGTPLLADFGVVREIDLVLTHTRTFAGTPIYSAPEQLRRDDKSFGPHTDVYGLGITLYEVLARAQPLQHHGLARLVQELEAGRIPPLTSRVEIATDLANIVHKAMSPEPEHRYASAAALADDLLAFLEHRPVAARPLSRFQRLRRWVRHEPWKAALAAVLAITVPALLGLGTKLVLEMPHIEQARLEELREEANRLRQGAYQAFFARRQDVAGASQQLHRAMQLDPSDGSLACLVTMVVEEDYAPAAALLAQHAAATDRHRGLQLIERKANQKRAFFDAGEVDELRASADPVDKFVLALDRVMWAEDAGHEEAYEEAEARINEASMAGDPDPLLFGLRAWVASRSDHRELVESVCQAMSTQWPADIDALTWQHMALEYSDAVAADRLAHEVVQAHPEEPRGWELLLGAAARKQQFAEVEQLFEQAKAAGVSSSMLATFRLLAQSVRGPEEARAALATMPEEHLTIPRRVRLLDRADPEASRRFCEDLLESARVSPATLEFLVKHAVENKDVGMATRAFARWRSEHPTRRSLYPYQVILLHNNKQHDDAASLAREITMPRRRVDTDAPQLCRLFTTERWWTDVMTIAQRWHRYGATENRPQAAFYVGLAHSRLGDHQAAAQQLDFALTVRVDNAEWYRTALLESAWVRVAPTAPARIRDLEEAQRLLARFDEACTVGGKSSGPWTQAVRAEVLFASGDKPAAIAAAETGLRILRSAELHAPEDVAQTLDAALQRYRQQ